METISENIEIKNGISYGWTSQKKFQSFKKLFYILKKFFKNYFDNSSIVGYKYLSEPFRPLIEKILWIVIQATTMCALGFMIIGLWQQYVCTPVVTVVDSDNYPSDKLDFPGIAICSINRISRNAAINLSKKIKNSNLFDKSFDKILELILNLGDLYDTAFNKNEKRENETHEMFTKYLGNGYDITEIMKTLTPKCTDILLACTFKSNISNCSDLLQFRKTQNGFCCTFNYAREADDIPSSDIKNYEKIISKKIENPGISNGLTIILEPFIDDYFFPFLPTTGWMITIFNPGDYPDNTSGGVSEVLVSPSTESFLELSVSSFYSENEIRPVSIKHRKCMFNDETSGLQTGYTYSDCIVDCRATAIFNSCNCRPFYLPKRGNDQYNRRICNTNDQICLDSYKSTWWSVLPHIPEPEESSNYKKTIGNENGSLNCENCYPACTDIRYYLQMKATEFQPSNYKTNLIKNIKFENQSIVHIYFKTYGSIRLKQDVGYYWYELLSDIGGTCGVFIGFSILSIIELIYFILKYIYISCCQYGKLKISKFNEKFKNNEKNFHGLYWNELVGHSKIYSERRKSKIRNIKKY